MSDTLEAVNNRAREVVDGVHVELGAGPVVGDVDVAHDDGVAHGAVLAQVVNLGAEGGLLALLRGLLHLLPAGQSLLDRVVAVGRRGKVASLLLHLLTGRVVAVSLADLDELLSLVDDLLEEVAGVRSDVRFNAHGVEVLQDGLLELLLLLSGIGIVETEDELAAITLSVELVEEGSLAVAQVEETRGLRRKSDNDLAVNTTRELPEGAVDVRTLVKQGSS